MSINQEEIDKWKLIQEYYDQGYTKKEVSDNFMIGMQFIRKAIEQGLFKPRTANQTKKLIGYKCSDETKQKLSERTKQYHTTAVEDRLLNNKEKWDLLVSKNMYKIISN